jgi:4-hydroxyproline epimerase
MLPLTDAPLRLRCVDSHTEGEPTRTLVDGLPGLAGEPRAVRAALDGAWAPIVRAFMLEPRGYAWLVGAVVLPPTLPGASFGVVFFNNVGTLGMCGHGTIGVVRTLSALGRLAAGEHVIETPVGQVVARLHADGRVSVRNVPSRVAQRGVAVEVPGHGIVHGDVAWGGNWFFICHDHGMSIAVDRVQELTAFCMRVRAAYDAAGLRGDDGAPIDHVELSIDAHRAGAPLAPTHGGAGQQVGLGADARNFVLCPGSEWDRSPCGTGTSARVACLAAEGRLAPGATWVQESVLGTRFEATYELIGADIVPTITGSAHVTFDGWMLIDPADPLARLDAR